MLYRSCPDIDPPDDADLDDPTMALAAAVLARGEQNLRTLSRLTEVGMELVEALGAYAKARFAAAAVAGEPLKPGEDPTAPFNKIAQTVRRTIALQAKLDEDVKTGANQLIAKRDACRAKRDADHSRSKFAEIAMGFRDVVAEDHPDLEGEAAERLLMGMDQLFYEDDEFADFLDRPVGETISMLCKTLGLDPALCVQDGDEWKVRRTPYLFEKSNSSLSASAEGQTARTVRVGNPDPSTEAGKLQSETTTDRGG